MEFRTVLLLSALGVVAIATLVSSGNGHYFQYANVPGWGQYEFGYNRGNDKHFTSRFEKAKGWTFKTKVRWGDAKGGWGESYWDYNHADKGWKKGNDGWKGHGKGHGHDGQGAFSENLEVVRGAQSREVQAQPQPEQQQYMYKQANVRDREYGYGQGNVKGEYGSYY